MPSAIIDVRYHAVANFVGERLPLQHMRRYAHETRRVLNSSDQVSFLYSGKEMGTRYPLARTSRRITYKLETHDVRKYLLADIVERVRRAITRSGGELKGGVYAPPKQITRWWVNRSPHVNKKSREKFWMITHKRVIKWDADSKVDMDAPFVISRMLPPSVAIRTVEDVPGLMALKDLFNTMQNMKEGVNNAEEKENSENEANEEGADLLSMMMEGSQNNTHDVKHPDSSQTV